MRNQAYRMKNPTLLYESLYTENSDYILRKQAYLKNNHMLPCESLETKT